MTDRVFPPLAAVSIAESGARDSSGAESGMQLARRRVQALSRAKPLSRGAKKDGDNPRTTGDGDKVF